MTATRTYVVMPVPREMFEFARDAMEEAGYGHAIMEDHDEISIDMHGVALVAVGCNADPINGGCDCCNKTGTVQKGAIAQPCHCLEGLR